MTRTKSKTKITVLLLIAVLFIASLGVLSLTASAAEAAPDLAVTIDTGGELTLRDADGDGYYDIGTADELYAFSMAVSSGEVTINGELTANIVVNEGEMTATSANVRVWIPIGNESTKYMGRFDGGGFTVSGLYFNDENTSNVGLFGYVSEEGAYSGFIQNVGVINSYFRGEACVGGVVGSVEGFEAKILHCYNTGSVSGTDAGIGGVIGENEWSAVEACYNTGTVNGDWNMIGGVVGYNAGAVKDCFNQGHVSGTYIGIGGIAGYNFGSVIENCYNLGDVTGQDRYVGGIVGYTDPFSTVSNCYYIDGCAKDGSNTIQLGIGSSTAGIAADDVEGHTSAKGESEFKSGEVAYLLSEGWGQTLGTDPLPVFATANNKVYYGYTTCDASQTAPIYTNSSAVYDQKPAHNEAFAHDGSYKCTTCGFLDRHSSSLRDPQHFTDAAGTHLTVTHKVINPPSFRRDSATISFRGGFLDGEVTLGLFNGRLATKNGETVSYGEKNAVGYVGAELTGDVLIFKYAFPPADEDHAAEESVTLSYTIRYYDESGLMHESTDYLNLKYVSYGLTTEITEHGVTLNLTFYSTRGTVIKENVYNAGTYSVTVSDYYGVEREYPYIIEESADPGTSITEENTENGVVITIERNDGNSIFVTVPEGVSGVTVQDNGRPRVKVTVTESVKLSYKHINYNGDEMVGFISVDCPEVPRQKPLFERLGYATVDWDDDREYALAADNLTKYRDGNVTVYLTNCIFKSTRSMVFFTFVPGGATTHTFSKDDILLIEDGSEHALTEDVTVSVGAVLVNDHVFLDATCTTPKTCKYCSHTDGDPAAHQYDNDCDATCNDCGESRTPAEHTDADKDFLCDECGASLPNNGDTRLGAGAVVGIAIGAVAAVGLGGLSLFWFVIKKKKWSDLVRIFKKQ